MKSCFLFLAVTISLFVRGQLLEEKTKILASDNNEAEALFELNADTRIYTYEPEYGWHKMRVEAFVPPMMLSEKILSADTDLQNEDGTAIGKTLLDVKVKESKEEEKFRGDKRMQVILEGYVFKTKIKDETMPEALITKALAIKNRTEQNALFDKLYNMYEFEKREFEDFEVHVLREEGKTLGKEKDFRLIVVNRGYGVYAVITNGQTVTAPKVKETQEEGKFKTIYLYKPSTAQKALMDDILYTYLAL